MLVNLHWIDIVLLIVYLSALTGIGIYFSKRQKSLEDFFLARRGMAWFPVGLSLMAAINSGMDYLMVPSAMGKFGVTILFITLSWPILYFYVGKITVPFYRKLNLYTAYEYLELRFDVRVRTLASVIFLLWRLSWMGTAIYVPCLAISAATGGVLPLVPMIVVLGIVVIIYTMLGGIRAVIWTDVTQFCIMFGGLAATVAIVVYSIPGGITEIFEHMQESGTLEMTFAVPPAAGVGLLDKFTAFLKEDVTVLTVLITMTTIRMAQYTCDQVLVQRFQTTKSVKDSKDALVISAIGDIIWMLGLGFVGMVLITYFNSHAIPPEFTGDMILPYFMSQVFPVGAVGLVIAAIFAASLSSIDSAINSCSSSVMVDFYIRLYLGKKAKLDDLTSEEQVAQVRVSRISVVFLGIFAIILASNVGRMGSLYEIINKVINLFTGPLFSIFILGMFTRWARSGGVLIGGTIGAVISVYTAFFTEFSFLWPPMFGLVGGLIIGAVASLILGPSSASTEYTFREVMKRSDILPTY
jgi:SSS family transporter